MGGWIPVFTGVRGLDAKHHPATLGADQGGAVELAEAVNCVIDDRKRISRRKGQEQVHAQRGDSLWSASHGDYLYDKSDGSVYRHSGGGASLVKSGLTGTGRMRHVEVSGVSYVTNGTDTGRINQGIWLPWEESVYPGDRRVTKVVTQALEPMARADYNILENTKEDAPVSIMAAPPAGQALAFYRGRIFVATGRYLTYTEPFFYCWWAPAENYFSFSSDIRFVQAVLDGLWVGTETELWFLAGADARQFEHRKVLMAEPIYGTDARVDASSVMTGEASGPSVLVATAEGVIWLLPGGQYIWMTKDKHDRLGAASGSATIYQGQYLLFLDA